MFGSEYWREKVSVCVGNEVLEDSKWGVMV